MSRSIQNIFGCFRAAYAALNLNSRIPRLATVEDALRSAPFQTILSTQSPKKQIVPPKQINSDNNAGETSTDHIIVETEKNTDSKPKNRDEVIKGDKLGFSTHQRLNGFS